MGKQGGLGSALIVGGTDLSGDISSLDTISGGPAVLDVTSIKDSAPERIGGLHNGDLQFTSWFNPGIGAAHPVFSALPTADVVSTVIVGPSTFAVGGAACSLIGKQINYDGTRGADGGFSFKVEMQSNGFGLEWGELLTAGFRTDTSATNGTGKDETAGTTFGAQGYLQLTALTGTDVTVKIQHSTDNTTFTDLIAFAQVTTAGSGQRVAVTGTVNRYVRVATVTTGGFTSATFAVQFTRNLTAVAF